MATKEKRGKNSWRLTVEAGTDANGERIRRRKTITVDDPSILRSARRLEDYLDLELAKFRIEVEAGEYIAPEKMQFVRFVELWLDKHAKKEYSPRTLVNYISRLETHIVPRFGHMMIDKIKPMHVVSFKDYLSTPEARLDGKNSPLSESSQLFIFKVLHAVMNSAKEWRVIPENPVDAVSPPKVMKKKKDVYGEEEAILAIQALLNLPKLWMLYFLGAMMGGFRRGELLALEWPDVDFERNALMIRQSISWTEGGEAAVKGTKEDTEEWVTMPYWYMGMLRQYQAEWDEEREMIEDEDWQGGNKSYVFHSGYGRPYYHDTPTGTWRKFLKNNNLRPVRLHDLRHTAATLLLEDGVDLKLIQERLRHARHETTADFYAHVTKKASRGVADRLEKFNPTNLGPLGPNWGQDSTIDPNNTLLRPPGKRKKA
ncbi:tyrosine-type recombinase/integrase [Paenibacillus spongiae]|uniref:Site-specific integrase n=1 Tax=Paenibacillus spongiae TaxID=2909671 RepID=A0ABY5S2S3_9BACL|nr:site-specific integrase [Paenibacillus spongiae]UVI28194.1 site-specific integrase [Paenibacillus spongiae]